MQSMINWSPNLRMVDYERFAINNAMEYTKGNLREVCHMLDIPLDLLNMKLKEIEQVKEEVISDVDYWRKHKNLVQQYLNGAITKEEFNQLEKDIARASEVSSKIVSSNMDAIVEKELEELSAVNASRVKKSSDSAMRVKLQ